LAISSDMLKICIITDAWKPQINGVVTTLGETHKHLEKMGHRVLVLEPSSCKTIPCPSYPEIRLALNAGGYIKRELETFQATHIHIATEGPLGQSARRYCIKHKLQFTTSYHTQFPEYIKQRLPIPLAWCYHFFRRFHNKAACTMVGTPHQKQLLEDRQFKNIVLWSRGVDCTIFKPHRKKFLDYPRPIWIYVGRVAVEKNIEAYLRLELTGTKVVIGDGPASAELKQRYPEVKFEGYRFQSELAQYLSAGDVFVFPSLTDTFGVVMLEAMACGLPVAAFPVTGPRDVVRKNITGILDPDLTQACLAALQLKPEDCLAQASEYTWQKASQQFLDNLAPTGNQGEY